MIQEAKKRFQTCDFMCADMVDLRRLTENKYDIIVCFASFHHLTSLAMRISALREMKMLLQDSGEIYMTHWALKEEKQKKYEIYCD